MNSVSNKACAVSNSSASPESSQTSPSDSRDSDSAVTDARIDDCPAGDKRQKKRAGRPSTYPSSVTIKEPTRSSIVGKKSKGKKAGRPPGPQKTVSVMKVNRQEPAKEPKLDLKHSRKTSGLVPDHCGQRMKFDNPLTVPLNKCTAGNPVHQGHN